MPVNRPHAILSLALALTLAACGGGSGDDATESGPTSSARSAISRIPA